MENLGNYRSTPDFSMGVQIGSTETSENFDVGKHCTGMTYDGKTVGSFWLKDEESTNDVSVVHIPGGEVMVSMMHTTTLDNWEKLLSDTLNHVQQLKKGKQL